MKRRNGPATREASRAGKRARGPAVDSHEPSSEAREAPRPSFVPRLKIWLLSKDTDPTEDDTCIYTKDTDATASSMMDDAYPGWRLPEKVRCGSREVVKPSKPSLDEFVAQHAADSLNVPIILRYSVDGLRAMQERWWYKAPEDEE